VAVPLRFWMCPQGAGGEFRSNPPVWSPVSTVVDCEIGPKPWGSVAIQAASLISFVVCETESSEGVFFRFTLILGP